MAIATPPQAPQTIAPPSSDQLLPPTPPTPPSPLAPQRSWWQRRGKFQKGLIVTGAIIVALIGISNLSNKPAQPAATATPAASVAAVKVSVAASTAPTAAPTASQRELALAYADSVQKDITPLSAAATQVSTGCTAAGDMVACRAGMVSMKTAVRTALANTLKPPACLSGYYAEWQAGLSSFGQAVDLGIRGIDTNQGALIAQGAAKLDEGTQHVSTANGLLHPENC